MVQPHHFVLNADELVDDISEQNEYQLEGDSVQNGAHSAAGNQQPVAARGESELGGKRSPEDGISASSVRLKRIRDGTDINGVETNHVVP